MKFSKVALSLNILAFSYLIYMPNGNAQERILVPLDPLLAIKRIEVLGNLQSGKVKIAVSILNIFNKPLEATLNLDGFENFGITDDQGHKYQMVLGKNTSSSGVHKGFSQITNLIYENKKIIGKPIIKLTIPPKKDRNLSFILTQVDRRIKVLKEFHLRGDLIMGDKQYRGKRMSTENIKIQWK